MVFDISFKEVVLSEERTVSREGRISGMSRYKGRRVNVVVEKASEVECNDPSWREQHPYQVELDAHTYSFDMTVDASGKDAHIENMTEESSLTDGKSPEETC